MSEGRKLRLWLIDDRPVSELETAHLELQSVPNGEDEDPSLGTWAQHLRLWSDHRFPRHEPDLILIDCRFEDDFQYVPMSESLRGHDPRGLLHGAIFIARMFGRDRFHPFGFAVYSMDASAFQQDAYAQTFMGFLLAMRDSTLAEGKSGFVRGRKDRELVASCSQELARTVSQNPASAWGPALQMYRQRLREVIDLQAIVVDKESWLHCLDALRTSPDSNPALAWRRFDGEQDRVQLSSLFADQLQADRWTPQAAQKAMEWLESLLVLGDYLGDARIWVHAVVIDQQDPEGLPVPRGQDLHGQRLTRFFHACAGVVAWYEDRRAGGQQSSSNLLLGLGLSDKQLNRYFKPLLDLPWGKVVDLLDEGWSTGIWPLPGQWELHRVARDWATHTHKCEFPLTGPTL
ncbi:hypothetical protein IV102_25205 [bacterium]|nr:hypothetical protein [bacterium]